MYRAVTIAVLAFLILASSVSCSFFQRPGVALEGYVELPDGEQRRVISELRTRAEEIESFRSLIRGELRKGVSRQTVKQVVVFERPDKLRMELLATGTNQLASMIIAARGELVLLNPNENEAFVGEASRSNIRKVLNVPFSLEELMLWICGLPYLPPDFGTLRATLFADKSDARVLELEDDTGRTVRVMIGGSRGQVPPETVSPLRVVGIDIVDKKRGRYLFRSTIRPASDEMRSNVRLPGSIEFEVVEEGISGTLVLDRPEINPDLRGRDLFTPVIPETMTIHDLDAARRE